MTLKEFNELSKKYLDGNTTEEEDLFLSQWLEKQPNEEPFSTEGDSSLEKRIWKNIDKNLNHNKQVLWRKIAIISSLAASLIIAFLYFAPHVQKELSFSPVINKYQGIEVSNTSEKPEIIKLEDGTTVLLSKNSSIVYGKNFNLSKREVYLNGEGFFDVKRDVTKPFIVRTGELSTEVLGTSFNVKHNTKTRKVEVEVASGKVSVYSEKKSVKNEKNGVIITPNQKVIFDEISENIQQTIVSNPKSLLGETVHKTAMIFRSVPLKDVLNQLSDIYGIQFVINNSNLQECKITADLNDLTMFIQLELICKSIDSSYEQRGSVIFINGEGC